VIAYEDNVEAMWPFPKFATQLIHVSEHRHSETSRPGSFHDAALRPGHGEFECLRLQCSPLPDELYVAAVAMH
jgi:hypothetical protein